MSNEINFRRLGALFEKGTPGECMIGASAIGSIAQCYIVECMTEDGLELLAKFQKKEDAENYVAFRNDAEELLRLAEMGERAESGMTEKEKKEFIYAINRISRCTHHDCVMCNKLGKSTAEYLGCVFLLPVPE